MKKTTLEVNLEKDTKLLNLDETESYTTLGAGIHYLEETSQVGDYIKCKVNGEFLLLKHKEPKTK